MTKFCLSPKHMSGLSLSLLPRTSLLHHLLLGRQEQPPKLVFLLYSCPAVRSQRGLFKHQSQCCLLHKTIAWLPVAIIKYPRLGQKAGESSFHPPLQLASICCFHSFKASFLHLEWDSFFPISGPFNCCFVSLKGSFLGSSHASSLVSYPLRSLL